MRHRRRNPDAVEQYVASLADLTDAKLDKEHKALTGLISYEKKRERMQRAHALEALRDAVKAEKQIRREKGASKNPRGPRRSNPCNEVFLVVQEINREGILSVTPHETRSRAMKEARAENRHMRDIGFVYIERHERDPTGEFEEKERIEINPGVQMNPKKNGLLRRYAPGLELRLELRKASNSELRVFHSDVKKALAVESFAGADVDKFKKGLAVAEREMKRRGMEPNPKKKAKKKARKRNPYAGETFDGWKVQEWSERPHISLKKGNRILGIYGPQAAAGAYNWTLYDSVLNVLAEKDFNSGWSYPDIIAKNAIHWAESQRNPKRNPKKNPMWIGSRVVHIFLEHEKERAAKLSDAKLKSEYQKAKNKGGPATQVSDLGGGRTVTQHSANAVRLKALEKEMKKRGMESNPKKKKKKKRMGKAGRAGVGAGVGALALGPIGAIGGAYLGSRYRAEEENPADVIHTKETDPFDIRLHKTEEGKFWYEIYDPVLNIIIDQDRKATDKAGAKRRALTKLKTGKIVLNPPLKKQTKLPKGTKITKLPPGPEPKQALMPEEGPMPYEPGKVEGWGVTGRSRKKAEKNPKKVASLAAFKKLPNGTVVTVHGYTGNVVRHHTGMVGLYAAPTKRYEMNKGSELGPLSSGARYFFADDLENLFRKGRNPPRPKKQTKLPKGTKITKLPPGPEPKQPLIDDAVWPRGVELGRSEGGWVRPSGSGPAPHGNPRKKVARKKSTPAKTLVAKCQKVWEHYCERPGKKRLKEVFAHLEKMKESTAESVKTELRRCKRSARAEAKRIGMKV